MAVDETPTPTPRFATVVRGYDRLQVDDYVEHLHRWIDQADYRAQQCEVAATRANSEAEQMRRRLASVDAGSLTATPESMKVLGDRVGGIMQSSFQAAKDLQRRAEDEIRSRASAAEETATQIISEATLRAEELSRAAEDLFVQAQEVLASAQATAGREVDEAKARGVAAGEELLERVRAEARELARRATEEEQVRREHLQALEDHRHRVMEEIGVLHERLGSIGEGLSAPAQPNQAKHRARQGELEPPSPTPNADPTAPTAPNQAEQSAQSAQPAQPKASDDDTMLVELPAGGTKPTRRKVASSAR